MAHSRPTRSSLLPVVVGGGGAGGDYYSLCSRSTAFARRAHLRRECFDARLGTRIDTHSVDACAGRSTTTTTAAAADDGVQPCHHLRQQD